MGVVGVYINAVGVVGYIFTFGGSYGGKYLPIEDNDLFKGTVHRGAAVV